MPLPILADAKRLLTTDPHRAAALAEAAGGADDAPMLLLASARRRSGDVAGAVEASAKLAARRPDLWGVQYEHGMALSGAGQPAPAIAALRRARAINPGAMLATHALWDLAVAVGERETGLPRPTIAALASPAVATAVAAMLDGDERAVGDLANRFGLDRNDAAAACLIAEIALGQGRVDAVVSLLKATMLRAAGHRPATFRLAQALHQRSDDAAALALLEPMLREPTVGAAVFALAGSIAMAMGRADRALEMISRAATLAPHDAGAQLALGHAHRAVGQRDAAVASYRAALALAPACGEAYWSIADLKSGVLTAEDVEAMAELLTGRDLAPQVRSHLHFALGHATEDAGRFEAAFAHYCEANRLRSAIEPFDVAAHEAMIERTTALCDAAFFGGRAEWGDLSDVPIFVIGMPRSGSTLVEQILARHPAIEGASELPDLTAVARELRGDGGYPEMLAQPPAAAFAEAGRSYLERAATRRQTTRRHFVDKFPGNVLHLPLIQLALPNARIIDVRRDARDCCVSLFAQSFARGQAYSYDLAQLGRVYAAYVRLTAHIDTVLPGRVLRVRYEDVVDNLEGQARRMLDHIGHPFDPACLRFFERPDAVRTASSEQVRRPLYRGAIGRWRRFAPFLGPLTDALRCGGVDLGR